MMPMIAVFAGSFDPPTLGHLEIIERASKGLEHLIVAVAINPEKKDPLLTTQERVSLLKDLVSSFSNVTVASFKGLTVDFAKEQKASLLVRGVRSAINYDEEQKMAYANHALSGLDTWLLPAFGKFSQITGKYVRQIAAAGGSLEPFVPESVLKQLLSHSTNETL